VSGSETGVGARLVAGRYWLLRELGHGGMGTVWLADDQLVRRQVAVKELRPPPGLPAAERDVFGRRALQEARSAARVHHPGAVALYDVLPASAADDAVYLIMELVAGPTLTEVIQRHGPLPDATVAAYGLQLLSVLEAAHALGVVHRDIKPGNIMIAAGDQVKLTDFGIAHIVGDPRLTRTGVLGTQAYLAPELFESAPITPAADVWSLGATLFHAAEGRGAFDRDTTGATLRALLVDEVPMPRCSRGLAAVIGGMLQRDPARRAAIGQARAGLLPVAAQPAAEMTGPPRLTWEQATTSQAPRSHRQDPPTTSPPAPERRWDQVPTSFSPSWPAPSLPAVSAPGVGSPAASDARGRRLVAGALLGLGTILGIAGLFPGYLTGTSLVSQPDVLVPHAIYIAVWTAVTAGVLRGGTMARAAALLGTGLGALTLGFPFIQDVGDAFLVRAAPGPGLVLSLAGWVVCTAGSVWGLTIRVKRADGVRRAAIGRRGGVLVVAAAVGTAVMLVPSWSNYTITQNGISRTTTVANTWPITASTIAIIVPLVAIAIIAALRRPIQNGAIMLAGAIVALIAQAISTVIPFSLPLAHVPASEKITFGETIDFWIYCIFLILLTMSCLLVLATRAGKAAPAARATRWPDPR
jgi:serine/threonine protein kinase